MFGKQHLCKNFRRSGEFFRTTEQKGFRNPFAKQLFDFKADRDWSISPIGNMKKFTGNIEGQEKRLSATGLDKREYMGWDRMRLCM